MITNTIHNNINSSHIPHHLMTFPGDRKVSQQALLQITVDALLDSLTVEQQVKMTSFFLKNEKGKRVFENSLRS